MKSSTPQKTAPDPSIVVLQRIREHWLSNTIHDFSNPLFAARGYVRLALEQRDATLSGSQRRYLAEALANLDKLVALSHELEAFREIDELECASVSLGDLLQRKISELRPTLAAKQAVLIEEITPVPLSTVGDPRKLSEAVLELLCATVEFTEPGGSLRIRASEENEKIILEVEATSTAINRGNDPAARLAKVCRTWRLHGGLCSFGPNPPGVYRIVCELPVVRPQEC
jgi:signal transduction histidine kinase